MPRHPRSLERRFWKELRTSDSLEAAGERVGVSYRVVARWMSDSGGVKPDLADTGYRVSFQERCLIEAMKEAGMTLRAIAARLGRAPSTISRELRRNGGGRGGLPCAQGAAAQRSATP